MKKIFNTFITNRWHLHSLTLPINILFMWLIVNYNFLDLKDTGTFFHIFLCTFSSLCLGFVVEWLQGVFLNANRTESQVKESNLDILATTIAGFVGVLSIVIFPTMYFIGYVSLVLTILFEIYRRKFLANKITVHGVEIEL